MIDDLVVSELALRRMDHPALLIHRRDDHIVPLETSLYLLEHLPQAQMHVFGNAVIGSRWSAQKFNQLLAQFFSGQI